MYDKIQLENENRYHYMNMVHLFIDRGELEMIEREIFDVTIIGGGPSGLFSAFYSGLREMKTKIIEYQYQLGGKVQLYPEKIIWDVGALPPMTGEQLIKQMVEQALTFDPTIVLGEKVTSIEKDETGVFILKTDKGVTHFSKAIIIAIGGGVIHPQPLKIEGAEKFEETNLHYTIRKLKDFKDKTVLISGGGYAAVDWANELVPIAKKVYLTYRKDREQMQAHEADLSRLFNSSVEFFFHTEISKLVPSESGDRIEYVQLTNNKTDEVFSLHVDEVLVNHGYDRDRTLIENSHLSFEMIDEHYIKGSPHCETNVPGIFAVGDVVNYDGKVHLLLGTFQDAVKAVNKAKKYIQPEAAEIGMVSSHNELLYDRNIKLMEKELQK